MPQDYRSTAELPSGASGGQTSRGSNSGEHGQSGEVLRRTPRCLVERRGKATVSQEEAKGQEAKGQEPQESQIRVEEQDLNIHFVYLFPRT